jgi:hypothetical protein
MFAHHFPDFKKQPVSGDPEGQGDNYYGAITLQMVRDYCPEAEEWIVRAGQRLCIAGAEIEIVFTVEELYPEQAHSMNDTTTTYRVTVDGVSAMLLGDSDARANNKMALWYGDALESNFLQFAHHSYNGEVEQYRLINPKICFWAQKSGNLNTGRGCNSLLKNSKWTRTNAEGDVEEGDRSHYYNDQDWTLYFKDIE